MYENYTYENILNGILDRISEVDPTIDVREGSAMWYAVSPVAVELAIAYTNLDAISKESFVGTATREGMYRACEDLGIDTTQFDATAGEFEGHFNIEVNIGSRWACGEFIFVVTSRIGTKSIDGIVYPTYRLVCETVGSQTQYTSGILRPITDYGSRQLKVAVLDSCVRVGADETSDERVRETYFDYIANKSEDANVAQYKRWVNEFDGVGECRVVPTWDGANTVKVVILNEVNEAPTDEFVDLVQEYLDPDAEGLGEGKAPIGAMVTVEGGVNAYIGVKAKLTLASANADISDITEKLTEHLRKIAFRKTVVNVYEVASVILSSPSVTDVNDVQVGRWNGSNAYSYSSSNLALNDYETPVLRGFYNE